MSSTSRFQLDPAPGGLFLVQDLVNTRGITTYGVRDLLATVEDAQRWTSTTLVRWQDVSGAEGGIGPVAARDLPALRRLRTDVERLLAAEGPTASAPAGLALGPDGRVRLQPRGTGVRWLASAVWGEVLLAQRDGAWPRLKVCRNPVCPCAFHDGSRNNSRVWHDVRTCGNVANLRASRARRAAHAG
jgi:hypothetical protein